MELARLVLKDIKHAYFGRTVVSGVTLSVVREEVVALVGPSGCGKSTLAHIAAGLIAPSAGEVWRGYARQGMVFQEPRLLPWATARGNIGYPLRFGRMSRGERQARIEAAAEQVALEMADLDKFPVELSGGMRQRTAIARALVVEPDFVYFDEPFTALDVALKRRMQDLVAASSRAAHFSALFITHDLMEAVRIAHRVVVMDAKGKGIAGERHIPGIPGSRDDDDNYRLVTAFLKGDPLFRDIYLIDERRLA